MEKRDFRSSCRGLGCLNDLAQSVQGEVHYLIISYDFADEAELSNSLVYLRNRYYSPDLGVFNSQDPYEGDYNEPMSLNRYGYVRGNPINGAVGELNWRSLYRTER